VVPFILISLFILMMPLAQGQQTILVANFVNGDANLNDRNLGSRVYLYNPSASAGQITVRVFTLPLIGGMAQELTTAPLSLGTLGARSALNIRLVEDILAPLGIPLPYTDDGGNLTLEFTIGAANVRGTTQIGSSHSFGTTPLQEIPATSGASPTVLLANFMNGNNGEFIDSTGTFYFKSPISGIPRQVLGA